MLRVLFSSYSTRAQLTEHHASWHGVFEASIGHHCRSLRQSKCAIVWMAVASSCLDIHEALSKSGRTCPAVPMHLLDTLPLFFSSTLPISSAAASPEYLDVNISFALPSISSVCHRSKCRPFVMSIPNMSQLFQCNEIRMPCLLQTGQMVVHPPSGVTRPPSNRCSRSSSMC